MKVSDYIVSFFIEKGISDVFGYPGGMVTHLMDSFEKYKDKISAHVNYHEQGSSFCACGYAQVSGRPGVAYATSGPGATNLITGIANAYFDSIPCIYITGQVNTYESKGSLLVRQKGFQETDIISIAKSITKYAVRIDNEQDIRYELEKGFEVSISGRPGPVLIDIPMNIQRADIIAESLRSYKPKKYEKDYILSKTIKEKLLSFLEKAKRPVILVGNGVHSADVVDEFRSAANLLGIPIVTSMIGRDIIPTDDENCFGFIGAYGNRYSNFIISVSDLIISIGARLDCRQTGNNMGIFAQDAKMVRFEVDEGELSNRIKEDEISFVVDLKKMLPILNSKEFELKDKYKNWVSACNKVKNELIEFDSQYENEFISKLSDSIPEESIITTDVGQNQVWVAQAFNVKSKQRMLFSGGHGAMGYSLPSAIGAYYGSRKNVISFNGDGGIQMNIQELQFIAREDIPVKVILLNNSSLGMIRHFQEMYFNNNFVQTTKTSGYTTPNFEKIANAYNLRYVKMSSIDEICKCKSMMVDDKPCFIEVMLTDKTYVYPKLAMGRPIYDQEPLLDRELINKLFQICIN